jgi:hypothetical protein
MIGKIEWWSPEKNSGFVVSEIPLGAKQRRLERFFFGGLQVVLLAVPEIKAGLWIRFDPGRAPRPGLKVPCLRVEVWESQALAWQADKARGASGNDAAQGGAA